VKAKLGMGTSAFDYISEPSEGSEPPAMGSGGGPAYARRDHRGEPCLSQGLPSP